MESKRLTTEIAVFVLSALYLTASAIISFAFGVSDFYKAISIWVFIVISVFGLILQAFIISSKKNVDRKSELFIFAVIVFCVAVSSSILSIGCSGKKQAVTAVTTLTTISLILNFLLITVIYFVQGGAKSENVNVGVKICNVLSAITFFAYFIICIVNVFAGCIFKITDTAEVEFINGDCITSAFLIVYCVIYFARLILSGKSVKEGLALSVCTLLLFCYGLIRLCLINNATAVKFGFIANIIYTVYLYMIFFSEYSAQSKLLLSQEKELSDQKAQMMLSQIQPHFLYNALSAISAIPETPDETREALSKFGKYLRGNINSITNRNPIPFSQELRHVETYLELEQMRFGDKLKIQYVIKEKDFLIPPLSLQMFVENAVKHGITQKEVGGKLTIIADCNDKDYVITVKDNGVGFNANAISVYDNGRAHVGINNAKNRLKELVNGSVEIESEIGEGTTVIIKIPKGVK